MTTINMHGVESITVYKNHEFDVFGEDKPIRKIKIKTRDNGEFEITLFADVLEKLDIIESEEER